MLHAGVTLFTPSQVIWGGGVRTPCTLPLDPPLYIFN